MRGKSMILIVVALGCGLVASIGISQILDSKANSGEAAMQMKQVYVATRNIDLKERITEEMVKLEDWPADRVAEDAITDLEQLEEMAAGQRLFEGEQLRIGKLRDPSQGKSIRIPKGFRVQAIKVKSEDVVGNIVEPGDHVDIQVYLKKSGTITQTSARTILSDVRVFAINSQTHLDTDAQGQTIKANTVSLLVKPDQVETLLLASRLGQISLSLRSPDDDTHVGDGEGKTPAEILRGLVEDGTPDNETPHQTEFAVSEPKEDPRSNFKDWLSDITAGAAQAKADQPEEATWEVAVITPDGITNYQVAQDAGYHTPQLVSGTAFTDTTGTNDNGLAGPALAGASDDADDADQNDDVDPTADSGDGGSDASDNIDAADDADFNSD